MIFPYTGIFSGVIAGIISAIGFGITSHILSKYVPKLVQYILGVGLSHKMALEARRSSYLQLIESYNLSEELYESAGALLQSELRVMNHMNIMKAKFEKPSIKVNTIKTRDFLGQLKGYGNE